MSSSSALLPVRITSNRITKEPTVTRDEEAVTLQEMMASSETDNSGPLLESPFLVDCELDPSAVDSYAIYFRMSLGKSSPFTQKLFKISKKNLGFAVVK
jgi:hypothetical protein